MSEYASIGQKIVSTAELYRGFKSVPYQGPEAGMSPENGFECSGYVTHVLNESGIYVPEGIRHVVEYHDHFGEFVHDPLPGDLIFFSYNGLVPRHIGIVTDPFEQKYIHAPGKKGSKVKISPWTQGPIKKLAEDPIYIENPIAIKRVVMRRGKWYSL